MRFARHQANEPVQPVHHGEEELEALLRASRAAATHEDLDAALDAILTAAIQLVGADEGSVQLLDPTTMTLAVAAGKGLSAEARAQRVAVGQGISGTVAATGEPVLLRSAVDVSRFIGHVPKDRPIYASMCVPLRTKTDTLGVLNVSATHPGGSFTERDLRLVTLFAETAAQTIANARLLSDARRHALELEILAGAMVRLSGSLDLATLVETTLQEALTLTSSQGAFICLWADEQMRPSLVRFAGLSRDAMRSVVSSPGFRVLDPRPEIRVIADVPADPAFGPLGPDLKGRALALVPLPAADGATMGLLGVSIPRKADGNIRRVLWAYATQAGLALSNAALHEEVSSSEEALETIVTSLDLPILLLDDEARFRAINPAAAAALQLSPDFEIGQRADGKLPPEIEELALRYDTDVGTTVQARVSGRAVTFRVTAATIREGSRTGARIVVLTDVSAQRDLEQRKADFVAVIGHELRTPLTSIKGFARTLGKHGERMTPEVRAESVRSILVQSERLQRLIEDLLYISGIEEGHAPPLHLSWEDGREICVQMIAELSRRSPDRVIRFDQPGDALPIYTDRVKVEQMLWHLLDNALKYSNEDTLVHVRLTEDERTVTISVADEGAGVYSGDLARIFDPFTQVDGSATRSQGGTGVGLYVSKTLAEALGGRIDVDSVLGRGSTFAIVVPKTAIDPQAVPADES